MTLDMVITQYDKKDKWGHCINRISKIANADKLPRTFSNKIYKEFSKLKSTIKDVCETLTCLHSPVFWYYPIYNTIKDNTDLILVNLVSTVIAMADVIQKQKQMTCTQFLYLQYFFHHIAMP